MKQFLFISLHFRFRLTQKREFNVKVSPHLHMVALYIYISRSITSLLSSQKSAVFVSLSAMEKLLFPVIGVVILVLSVSQQVKGNAGKKRLIF